MNRIALLILAAATLAAPALGRAAAPDAPISTAPAAAPPLADDTATVQQIDAWTRGGAATDAAPAANAPPDRRVRGSVTVGVGTGGYRQASAEMQARVGDKAMIGVAVTTAQGGRFR